MKKLVIIALITAAAFATTARANDEPFSEVEYYRKLAEKQLAEAQALAEAEIKAEPEPEPEPEPAPEPEPVPPPLPDLTPVAVAIAYVGSEPEPPPQIVVSEPPLPELAEPVYQYKEIVEYPQVLECYSCDEEKTAPPGNAIIVVPQYFHSRNDDARFDVGGAKLKMAKGHANGAGFTLLYNRRITDFLTIGFTYEFAFLNVKGGMAIPDALDMKAKEDSRWQSHVVGIIPEFNLGKFGKLQLSVIQGFDRASGHETMYNPDGTLSQRRSVDDFGTNVTSLMAWYEKDINLAKGFTLTPYAGWRSLYVHVMDQNDWSAAPGVTQNDSLWVHLASAGIKASVQTGAVGLNFRAGVSHRTTSDDLPSYGNRAVAPGVVQFSHRANLDRTVGSFGAGISFAIKKRAMVGLNYDGFVGKNTSAHTATLSFALPF